jgi:hypothetical protein
MSHWSSGPPISFPSWGTLVQSPGGYLHETGILLLALSRYIGDPDVIDQCGLVWGVLRPEPSVGCCPDNVIIPLDLTQLFCPVFTLTAGSPSGFTTDIFGCWGGALWRACNLTALTHSLTGPVGQPFASCHEGPRFNPQGGTYVKLGFSCWRCLTTAPYITHAHLINIHCSIMHSYYLHRWITCMVHNLHRLRMCTI